LFWLQGIDDLPGNGFTFLKISGAITVNWIADFPLSFDDYAKAGPYYDYFFTSGTDALEMYRECGNKKGYWVVDAKADVMDLFETGNSWFSTQTRTR